MKVEKEKTLIRIALDLGGLILLFVVLSVILPSEVFTVIHGNAPSRLPESEDNTYLVTKVIDGDTIEIEGGVQVRYVGIDTPEDIHIQSMPLVECFGRQATQMNKELVEQKMVRLEKDISDRDRYNRLLRYVWVGNIFVNDYLIRQGYAHVYNYHPDIKYYDQFVQAQREAKKNVRGLWADCQFFIFPD